MSPRWHGQPQRVLTAFTAAGTATKFGGVTNLPSIWNFVPNVTFSVGVTATFPVSGTYQSNNYVTDPENDTITLTKNSVFVQGVTWDGGKFITNGTGSATTSTGHILTANDGRGHFVNSSAFEIALITTASVTASISGTRVLLSEWKDGPDWTFANSYLHIRWDNLGGDYVDANNTSQGSTPFASCSAINSGAAGQTRTWSIGTLINRLRGENTGIYLKATTGGGNFWFASKENGTYNGPSLSVVTASHGTFTPTLLKDYFIVSGIDSENLYNNYNGQLGGLNSSHAILLKFDLSVIPSLATISSATLTMTTAGAGSTAYPLVYGAFLLDPPSIITQPELQIGGAEDGIASVVASDSSLASHTSVVAYDTFESLATINNGNWRWVPRASGTWANGVTYTTFSDGTLPAAELTVEPGVGWGTSGNSFAKPIRVVYPPNWHNTLDGTTDNPLTPPNRPWCREWADIENAPTEAYLRYVIEIDEDADVGLAQDTGINMVRMARLANVLDDISNGINPEGQGDVFSYAPSFGGVGFRPRGNPSTHGPIFRAQVYVYDYENGMGAPGSSSDKYLLEPNICFEAGKKYVIEQYVKLNTWNGQGTPYDGDASHWNSDGIQRIWVNGVRCQLRSYSTGLISNFEGGRKIRTHEKERIIFLPWGDFFAIGPINPAGSAYHLKVGAMAVTTDKTTGGVAYIGPPVKPLPSWAASSVVGTWMDIPGTLHNTVTPPAQNPIWDSGEWRLNTPGARLGGWSGPSFRKNGSVMILGPTGGHGDYFMNWLSHVRLGDDSPSWSVLDAGSPIENFRQKAWLTSDLRPYAMHSYYSHSFCEQRDWHMVWDVERHGNEGNIVPWNQNPSAVPGDVYYEDLPSANTRHIMVYDYTARAWLAPYTVADAAIYHPSDNVSATASPHCTHPVTGDIFYGRQGAVSGLAKWIQAENRQVVLPQGDGIASNYIPTAVDPIRDQWVYMPGGQAPVPGRIANCSTGLTTQFTLVGNAESWVNQPYPPDPEPQMKYPQMHWIDHFGKFLYMRNRPAADGATVRLAWVEQTGAAQFTATEYVASNAPVGPYDGINTKFHYAPELRGIVLVINESTPVKYLRLW